MTFFKKDVKLWGLNLVKNKGQNEEIKSLKVH